jgi:SM-20-related protein
VDHIASPLLEKSFSVTADFLSSAEVETIRQDLLAARAAGRFKRAGISTSKLVSNDVRRDEILWLDPERATTTQMELLHRMELLRLTLNRKLYLGLRTFEGHYASYPPGGFYKRHLDRFAEKNDRMVSVSLYLNTSWLEKDGGKLYLYAKQGPIEVLPIGGTLACFLSGEVEHEVTESHAERLSFTGWFKT